MQPDLNRSSVKRTVFGRTSKTGEQSSAPFSKYESSFEQECRSGECGLNQYSIRKAHVGDGRVFLNGFVVILFCHSFHAMNS